MRITVIDEETEVKVIMNDEVKIGEGKEGKATRREGEGERQ